MLKIVVGRPPNYGAIVARFHPDRRAIFTYGDTLYIPFQYVVSPDLIVHEGVHQEQQRGTHVLKNGVIEDGPAGWWARYLTEPSFVLEQEVAAYRTQYRWVCKNVHNKSRRRWFLLEYAKFLASASYGRVCTLGRAIELIGGGK